MQLNAVVLRIEFTNLSFAFCLVSTRHWSIQYSNLFASANIDSFAWFKLNYGNVPIVSVYEMVSGRTIHFLCTSAALGFVMRVNLAIIYFGLTKKHRVFSQAHAMHISWLSCDNSFARDTRARAP